jgi:hypothetical protein
MKIRIKGNTIRYRLTQSEVATLCEQGYLEEITSFNTGKLLYAVQIMEGIEQLEAEFTGDRIILLVPETQGKRWDTSDEVSIRNSMALEEGGELELLLEKDFACLDERDEDQSDNYPNPKAADNMNG